MTDLAVVGSLLAVLLAYAVGWLRGSLWANMKWCDEVETRFGETEE
jgi:hypothetical protein